MNDKILMAKNKIWHFYFKNGIYMKNIESALPPSLVFKDAYFDFDVTSDSDNTIHLICQDKTGAVIYFFNKENSWEKKILLLSKTKTAYNKAFKIVGIGKLVFALYTIVKDSKSLLVFHCLNENLTPVVVDYITPAPRSFFVKTRDNYDVFIYYSNSSGDLGFKKYQWSKKAFLPFESIFKGGICPFSEDDKTAFLCNGKIFLHTKNETDEILSYTPGDISAPICFNQNGRTFLMWKKDNTVYCFNCQDGKEAKRLLSPSALPSLFEIKTNSFLSVYLYGTQTQNGIHLISPDTQVYLKDFFSKKDDKTDKPADKMDMILEKLYKIEKMLGGMQNCLL